MLVQMLAEIVKNWRDLLPHVWSSKGFQKQFQGLKKILRAEKGSKMAEMLTVMSSSGRQRMNDGIWIVMKNGEFGI
jgi:hypothetical protein